MTSRAGRREWTALGVLMLPLLLVSMDVSVLYFAVPSISADLAPSGTQQLWIFDIYAFVLAGLLMTMGSLGDRIGHRRLLLIGAAAFGAASLLAAYANSAEMLIAARAVLGVGGATLMPSTMAMLRTMFTDPAQRAKAIGVWSGVMTAGIALGSVMSGVLVEHFWWGSVFLVNLPAMALLLVLGPLLLPERGAAPGAPFDVLSSCCRGGGAPGWSTGLKEWAGERHRAPLDRVHRRGRHARRRVRASPAEPPARDDRRRPAPQPGLHDRGGHQRDQHLCPGGECGLHDGLPPAGARLQPAGRPRCGAWCRPWVWASRHRSRRASRTGSAPPGSPPAGSSCRSWGS